MNCHCRTLTLRGLSLLLGLLVVGACQAGELSFVAVWWLGHLLMVSGTDWVSWLLGLRAALPRVPASITVAKGTRVTPLQMGFLLFVQGTIFLAAHVQAFEAFVMMNQ
jgi:hypothetical protein